MGLAFSAKNASRYGASFTFQTPTSSLLGQGSPVRNNTKGPCCMKISWHQFCPLL